MKILMVNKFLYKVGGCENYMLGLGEMLKENGNEVQYFGLFSEKNIVFNDYNIYVKSYDDKKVLNPFSLIYNKNAYKKMIKIIKEYKPDIVHMNNISYHLTSSIIDACKHQKVPVVMTIHDPQLVCPNHMLYRYDNKEICNKCITENNFKNCLKYKCIKGSKLKSFLGYKESVRTHKKLSYNYISKLICPSCFISDKLIDGGYSEKKIEVLRNYASIEKNKVIPIKKDYILFFGRLSEEKGIQLLLNALPDNLKLIVAGNGPLLNELKKNNKKNVEFVGFKSGVELRELISGAMFSVYPSKWYENCPLSIFESISLCTPVIASNCGGNPELIDDKKTGLLYKNNDIDDLKMKIEYLTANKDVLNNMYLNCLKYERVPNKFDYYKEIMKIYEEVIISEKNVK